MFFDYDFLRHMSIELNDLNDLENEFKQLRYYNKKKLIEQTINICQKEIEYNKEKDYKFIINNKKIIINENEFWEKWNINLEKIIEGELK